MKETENKTVVIGNYPKAECREIQSPSGPYYMIYDMESTPPRLLGYNIMTTTESAKEDSAWGMAAEILSQKMIEVLEK